MASVPGHLQRVGPGPVPERWPGGDRTHRTPEAAWVMGRRSRPPSSCRPSPPRRPLSYRGKDTFRRGYVGRTGYPPTGKIAVARATASFPTVARTPWRGHRGADTVARTPWRGHRSADTVRFPLRGGTRGDGRHPSGAPSGARCAPPGTGAIGGLPGGGELPGNCPLPAPETATAGQTTAAGHTAGCPRAAHAPGHPRAAHAAAPCTGQRGSVRRQA
jgi:hypothetical protein